MSDFFIGIVDGLRAVFAFDPWFSLGASALAAAVLARNPRVPQYLLAFLVLAAGWALHDGAAIAEHLTEAGALSAAQETTHGLVALTVGALGGFLVGYALPTWAGAFVGQRVTWGTGIASAVVVAITVSSMMTRVG